MGSYVNVGATVGGSRPKSKKALKEALMSDPSSVLFDPTSAFDGMSEMCGDDLPVGPKLVVTGPDPYNSRKWHATVTRTGNKVTIT